MDASGGKYDVSGNVEAQYMDAAQLVLRNKPGIPDLHTLQVREEEALAAAYETILGEARTDTPMTSEFLNCIKNSSVALTIRLMELTARARAMQEMSFQVFEAFTAATVVYIIINIAVTYGMRLIERRAAVPGLIGAAAPVAAH